MFVSFLGRIYDGNTGKPHVHKLRGNLRIHGVSSSPNFLPGKAWVRFELANIPKGRSRISRTPDSRSVVMRIIEFLIPPNPGETVSQVKGELVKKFDPRTGLERPWAMSDISRFITPSSMKILEEAYPVSTTMVAPSGRRSVSN